MGRRRKKKRKTRKGRPESDDGPPELSGYARLVVETPVATLDLHGLTAGQAERRLADFLRTQTRLAPGKVVHVITGRGSRSEEGPVLPGVVNRALREEHAGEVAEVAGLPGRGALAVRLS